LERMVEDNLAPDLSSYLDAGALLPLPINSFSLDAAGVTFYYPSQQLTMLSGKSGAVNFHYDEIASLLNLQEGSLLWALGIMEKLGIHAGTKDEVAEYAASGRLPGLPVRLGDNLNDVMTEYPLHGGRSIQGYCPHCWGGARFAHYWHLELSHEPGGHFGRANKPGPSPAGIGRTGLITGIGRTGC
jgi:hypothetical protein